MPTCGPPFRDGVFAEVTHLWCLYHVDDPEQAVAEAVRVLRSGGTYYACTSACDNDPELMPEGYLPTSFDAEDAVAIVGRTFGDAMAEHWDGPFFPLERREDVEAYCRHHSIPAERAVNVPLPLWLTKRGVGAGNQALRQRRRSYPPHMLLGLDEYPFHQVTNTFAAVDRLDPSWNDGHYLCVADQAGTVAFTSNVRLYANNDVLDGFVCLRHRGRQYNVRVSRRLRPAMEHLGAGPLSLDIIEPLEAVRLVLDDNEVGIKLDITCHTANTPYMGPIEVRRVDGRLLSERATYEITGECEGWVEVAGERIVLERTTSSFFRNHSWGFQPGRGGPRPYGAPAPSHRVPGLRQWVLFHLPDHGGFFFQDPSGRAASGRGAILRGDRIVPVTDVVTELDFHEGDRRVRSGSFRLTDVEANVRNYEFEDLGWVYCQGGGYFGGFDDGLGQGVYRGDEHFEGEVWDVSHPTTIVDADGRSFEFQHDWAENFTLVREGGRVGLAHYECVRVQPSS
ncbi:MAG: methyltransferase domain-containing protein [Acidimicrobiales bacterium]